MNIHFDLLVAVIYAAIFLGLIFRAGMFQWFWCAVLLWLGVAVVGSKILPGMWGMTHVGPLFIPHFYLTVASLFFFIDHWSKNQQQNLWEADCRQVFLSLFAVSNVLMSFSFVILAGAAYYHFPSTVSAIMMASLLKFYALNPALWFVLQFVLMGVFYVHRAVIMRQSAAYFSKNQLQGGFLLVLLLQSVSIVMLMAEGRH